MKNLNDFEEIRPYSDHEVTDVINRLKHHDAFIEAVARYFYPRLFRWFPNKVKVLASKAVADHFTGINNIDAFQQKIIKPVVQQLIKKTLSKLTFSGIEHLSRDMPCLFLSNHRDIALDPVLTSYVLHINQFPTLHVAIGDNLLKIPFVTDLMRLNKSFIVKRSISGLREKAFELKRLSHYINYLIENNHSVWLANREGRAKDGLDIADPAIIKMLYFSQKRNKDFTAAIQNLNIVPVTIAYEYDPCDLLKARELLLTGKQGKYTKEKNEDIDSIVGGITGNKGQVHVHFSRPVTSIQHLTDPETAARHMDEETKRSYHLYPSNYTAYKSLFGNESVDQLVDQHQLHPEDFTDEDFILRLAKVPEALRKQVLSIYANPVIQRYNLTAPDEKTLKTVSVNK